MNTTGTLSNPGPASVAGSPGSATRSKSVAEHAPAKLGLVLLVALVVGSIIGSGIFGLPQNMAAGAGAGAAVAAGPAVAVVAAAEGAKAAKSAAQGIGTKVGSAVDTATPDTAQNEWRRVPNEPPVRDFSEPLPRDEP